MDVLRRFLPFAKGIPSHDTLNDIINAIDGDLFAACFTQWVASLGGVAPNSEAGPEVVAIDGKTSRRTHDRAQDRNPLHLVSAGASGQRLVLNFNLPAEKILGLLGLWIKNGMFRRVDGFDKERKPRVLVDVATWA